FQKLQDENTSIRNDLSILETSVTNIQNISVDTTSIQNLENSLFQKLQDENTSIRNDLANKMDKSEFVLDGKIISTKIDFDSKNNLAVGTGVVATEENLTAFGKYNKEDKGDLFVVGNGSEDSKSNILAVTEKNVSVNGHLYINGKKVVLGVVEEVDADLLKEEILKKLKDVNVSLTNEVSTKMKILDFDLNGDGKIDKENLDVNAVLNRVDISENGLYSLALGSNTTATEDNMLAIGKYNESPENTLLAIGNGLSEDSRNNILTITEKNVSVNGQFFINGAEIRVFADNETANNSEQYIPIDISSFLNADVIYNRALAGETEDTSIDSHSNIITNKSENLFTEAFKDSTGALPNDGVIQETTAHKTITLAYSNEDNGNNVINLTSDSTIILDNFQQGKFDEIHIFAVSGDMGSKIGVKLYYDNDDESESSLASVPVYGATTVSDNVYFAVENLSNAMYVFDNGQNNLTFEDYNRAIFGIKFPVDSTQELIKVEIISQVGLDIGGMVLPSEQVIFGVNLNPLSQTSSTSSTSTILQKNRIAIGEETIANNNNMLALGKYNDITQADLLFAVGNGSEESSRSNALQVDSSGNVVVNGKIFVDDKNIINEIETINSEKMNTLDFDTNSDNKIDSSKIDINGVLNRNIVVESGLFSLALGTNTTVTENNMLAIGKFNESPENTLFAIGNGSEDSKSNILTVTEKNISVTGSLFIAGTELRGGINTETTQTNNHGSYTPLDISPILNEDAFLNKPSGEDADTENDSIYGANGTAYFFTKSYESEEDGYWSDNGIFSATENRKSIELTYSNEDNGNNIVAIRTNDTLTLDNLFVSSYDTLHFFIHSMFGDQKLSLKLYYQDGSIDTVERSTLSDTTTLTYDSSQDYYIALDSLGRYGRGWNGSNWVYSYSNNENIYGLKFQINSSKTLTKIEIIPEVVLFDGLVKTSLILFGIGLDNESSSSSQETVKNGLSIGEGTVANNDNMLVIGQYNDTTQADLLFAIGNGSEESSRNNAFQVDSSGNVVVNGNIFVDDKNIINEIETINSEKMNTSDFDTNSDNKIDSSKIDINGVLNRNIVVESGLYSLALGTNTTVTENNMLAVGKFNESPENTLFAVGNGSDEQNRSNILTATETNVFVNGSLFIAGTELRAGVEPIIDESTQNNENSYVPLDISSLLNADLFLNTPSGEDPDTENDFLVMGGKHCFFTTSFDSSQNSSPDNGFFPETKNRKSIQLAYNNEDNGNNTIVINTNDTLSLNNLDVLSYDTLHFFLRSTRGLSSLAIRLFYEDGSVETSDEHSMGWTGELNASKDVYYSAFGLAYYAETWNGSGYDDLRYDEDSSWGVYGLKFKINQLKTLIKIEILPKVTTYSDTLVIFGIGLDLENPLTSQKTVKNGLSIGEGTVANNENMLAIGQYNDETQKNILFAVGNGNSEEDQSNAFQVDKYGDVKIRGELLVNGKDLIYEVNKTVSDLENDIDSLKEFDRNNDGKVDSDKFDSSALSQGDMFKSDFDINNDGKIDSNKFDTSALFQGDMLKSTYDTNNDGKVDSDKFDSSTLSQGDMFKSTYDINSDGKIDSNKFDSSALSQGDMFKSAYDINNDGKIDSNKFDSSA
ncbi:hypothetical protein ThvES_00019310, partial [Thiovulum sp. ES]